MDQSKNVLKRASRKIGIKLLDNGQIKSIFPDYDRILSMIQEQRRRIDQSCANQNTDHSSNHQYHLMHDNVIGIFGGRGSGKTSILFSLWEQLRRMEPQDIMLPIISPELISGNCSILLWVLSMLRDTVEQLDENLKQAQRLQREFDQEFSDMPSCERKKTSILKERYQTLLHSCSSDPSVQGLQKYDYADAVTIQMYHSGEQYALMQKLNQFWEMLAFIKKRVNSGKHGKSPLIFIMFDDIDLAPERSMELLLSAYKYFSNANVVIVLTAAMKMLREVLTCRMYEKVVGSDFPSLIQGNDLLGKYGQLRTDLYQLDRASDAAIEYLNKVIPQSSRFFLERFDTLDRKSLYRYPMDWEEDYNPAVNASIPLCTFLIQALQESGLLRDQAGKPLSNFFLENTETEEKRFAKEYYLLFGDKSRYISNSCLMLLHTFEQLNQIKESMQQEIRHYSSAVPRQVAEDHVREIYIVLYNLLTTLISSHTREMEACNQWKSELLHYQYGNHYIFIHYTYLVERYHQENSEIKERVARELADVRDMLPQALFAERNRQRLREELLPLRQKISVLFILLNLLEQLTRMVAPLYYKLLGQPRRTRSIHGRAQLLTFLNLDALSWDAEEGMKLFPDIPDDRQMLHVYTDILSNPGRFLQLSIRDSNRVSDYFSYISEHPILRQMLSMERGKADEPWVYTTCQNDPDWMKTVCAMLYLNKSGIQLLPTGFFSGMLQLFDDLALIPEWEDVHTVSRNAARNFGQSWNLQVTADRWRDRYLALCKDRRKTDRGLRRDGFGLRALSERGKLQDYLDGLVAAYIKKNRLQFEDAADFPKRLSSLVTELHLKISKEISRWPLEFHVEGDSRELIPALEALSNISVEIEEWADRVSEGFISGDLAEERVLAFYTTFRMLQLINYRLKHTETDEAHLMYDIYGQPFNTWCSALKLAVKPGREDEMNAYWDDVLTLLGLLPYYFGAQFTLLNRQQYMEFRVLSATDKTDKDDTAALYRAYVRVFQEKESVYGDEAYNLLRQIMMEVRTGYGNQILHALGVDV